MSVGLVMMVKDEADWIGPTLQTVLPLIDHWTITDTGSIDDTEAVVRGILQDVPGVYRNAVWADWATNRSDALVAAKGTAEWLLTLDADVVVDAHPLLATFLDEQAAANEVDAWQVQLVEGDIRWRLPWLMRGELDWAYRSAAHEYLDGGDRRFRPLDGLTLHHRRNVVDAEARQARLASYVELLAPALAQGDPRATFYTAEALARMGHTEAAILFYHRRAAMDAFPEEAWYAAFQAAKLAENVDGLIAVHKMRPWRPEPLLEAARIVAKTEHNDVLWVERIP